MVPDSKDTAKLLGVCRDCRQGDVIIDVLRVRVRVRVLAVRELAASPQKCNARATLSDSAGCKLAVGMESGARN